MMYFTLVGDVFVVQLDGNQILKDELLKKLIYHCSKGIKIVDKQQFLVTSKAMGKFMEVLKIESDKLELKSQKLSFTERLKSQIKMIYCEAMLWKT